MHSQFSRESGHNQQ
jgi:hypothetical protein